jgi:hypothetical protein
MSNFWLYISLAAGGHIFHICKQWLENYNRKQVFVWQKFVVSEIMNVIAIFLLTYLGINAPSDWLTMSPIVAIMIGGFGSSILSGLINTKKPKEDEPQQPYTAQGDAELNK